MKVFKKKNSSSPLTKKAALNYRPIKNPEIKEKRLKSGEVMLTYFISVRPWMAKLARRFGQNKVQNFEKKIQLDELGTTVWDMIDGNHSVQQIIDEFSSKYRVHVKEAEVAVTSFIKTLGKRELIGLK